MKNIQLFETQLDLSAGAVTIPQNNNGDQQVLINSFELTVPSTINIDVQYSIDGMNFVALYSGISNTEKKKGGFIWRAIKFSKNSGSTSTIDINFAQGISNSANTPDASTTADAESNPSTTRTGSLGYSYNGSTWDRVRSGIVAVATSFVGWINTLPGLRYNATPPTLADGNIVVLQGDINGNLKSVEQRQAVSEDNTNGITAITEKLQAGVSTYAPTLFTNYGANLTLNVKATAGNVYSMHFQNNNASARYGQIHNVTTTPSGGAVPLVSFLIPPNSFKDVDHTMLPAGGLYCSTGIAFAISTTLATYTASATANEHNTFITYK